MDDADHHLNCGTDHPVGGALFDGRSVAPLGRLACHCLLIETPASGLVLVDTGYGLRDVATPHRHPHPRITRPWRPMLYMRLREPETAARQVEALGYAREDVRPIGATHLDSITLAGCRIFRTRPCTSCCEYSDATGTHASVVARDRWRGAQLEGVTD